MNHRCANHAHLARLSRAPSSSPLRLMRHAPPQPSTEGSRERHVDRPYRNIFLSSRRSWAPGQPDDDDGVEDCVVMKRLILQYHYSTTVLLHLQILPNPQLLSTQHLPNPQLLSTQHLPNPQLHQHPFH
ncbi:hypothetical protein N1851_015708 [Merluccius polli]|uniref:Uncharacterized protein n=1 Tax=Merluccius polli TaxID=89951 RepID=A0AA47MSP1_MERPO|nr:hypothetical protein N1851_015708 [Merluccius polli]